MASVCECVRAAVCECDYSRTPRAPETPFSPLISLSVHRRAAEAAAPGGKRGAGRGACRRLRAPGGSRAPRARAAGPRLAVLTDAHRHGVTSAAPLGARASDRSRDLSERGGQRSRSRRDMGEHARGDLGPGAPRPGSRRAVGPRTSGAPGGVCALHAKLNVASPRL